MKDKIQFIRTTARGGLLFVAPLFVLIFIFGSILSGLGELLKPITDKFPYKSFLGLNLLWIFIFLVFVLFCFLAGLFAASKPNRTILNWLEKMILSNIPGYTFMKKAGENIMGLDDEKSYPVVLVMVEEAWQLGFLTERIDENHVAVYIPGAPSPWSGNIFIMTNERIANTNMKYKEVLNMIKNLGAGSAKVLSGNVPEIK